ncbi:MAG: hypothetical protein JRK53_03045 [Deltaproteobacteria bacterium]|nr:hypothetical protein [Deltaproteobacteria bacterium]
MKVSCLTFVSILWIAFLVCPSSAKPEQHGKLKPQEQYGWDFSELREDTYDPEKLDAEFIQKLRDNYPDRDIDTIWAGIQAWKSDPNMKGTRPNIDQFEKMGRQVLAKKESFDKFSSKSTGGPIVLAIILFLIAVATVGSILWLVNKGMTSRLTASTTSRTMAPTKHSLRVLRWALLFFAFIIVAFLFGLSKEIFPPGLISGSIRGGLGLVFLYFVWNATKRLGNKNAAPNTMKVSSRVNIKELNSLNLNQKDKRRENILIDEQIYNKIADEIDGADLDKAVWTQAFALAEGDETRTKVQYIKLRYEKLANSLRDSHIKKPEPKEKEQQPQNCTDDACNGFINGTGSCNICGLTPKQGLRMSSFPALIRTISDRYSEIKEEFGDLLSERGVILKIEGEMAESGVTESEIWAAVRVVNEIRINEADDDHQEGLENVRCDKCHTQRNHWK